MCREPRGRPDDALGGQSPMSCWMMWCRQMPHWTGDCRFIWNRIVEHRCWWRPCTHLPFQPMAAQIRPPIFCRELGPSPQAWSPPAALICHYFVFPDYYFFTRCPAPSRRGFWPPVYILIGTPEATMTLLPDVLILRFGNVPQSMIICLHGWSCCYRNLWNVQTENCFDFLSTGGALILWWPQWTSVEMATDGAEVAALKCPSLPAFITAGRSCCTFRGRRSVGEKTLGRLIRPLRPSSSLIVKHTYQLAPTLFFNEQPLSYFSSPKECHR